MIGCNIPFFLSCKKISRNKNNNNDIPLVCFRMNSPEFETVDVADVDCKKEKN